MPVFVCLGQLELLGQSIYDFIHPCDQEELTDLLTPRPGQILSKPKIFASINSGFKLLHLFQC